MHDYNDWKAFWGLLEYERENLYKIAQGKKTVIDVGTNNGWVVDEHGCNHSKKQWLIYGFEPFPPTYDRCIKNIKSSNVTNAQVFNLGCGESENVFEMEIVYEANSGQNRIEMQKTQYRFILPD